MGDQVPIQRTSESAPEAARFLVAAYSQIFGEVPGREEAELLLAQIWLESGAGHSLNNNNPGNLTAGAHWGGDYWRPPWYELTETSSARDKYLHEQMLKGAAPKAFRSYASAGAGWVDHFQQLRHTFPTIIEAARTGDPGLFAKAVQSSGYCPDCAPKVTEPTFAKLADQFRDQGVFEALPLALEPPDEPEAPPESSSCLPSAPPLSSFSDEDADRVPDTERGK